MRFLKPVLVLSASLFCQTAFSDSPPNYNLDHDHVPGQLLVRYQGELASQVKQYHTKDVRLDALPKINSENVSVSVLTFVGVASTKEGLKAQAEMIEKMPGVLSVEANVIYHLNETIPNDPEFSRLYGLKNLTNPGKDIDVTSAWDISTGSKDIVVGVIDTGIDYNHPDLADNIWVNPGESGTDSNGRDKATNGIDDDGNGYVDDVHGWDFINGDNDPMDDNSHGSHCAGTIGGIGDNGIGVVGVNWEVSMAALKVFSGAGSTTTDALAEAINYATLMGMDLTSNSWGGGARSALLEDAIGGANQAGILFVAAAGNSSSDNDRFPHYPSSYEFPNVIAVAATDDRDNLAGFSSYGATSVDVAAPGNQTYSTIPGGGYGYKSGTSMATPHVAGLVALAKSVFPDFTYLEIKDRVLATSRPLPQLEGRVAFGRISAGATVEIDDIGPSRPGDVTIQSLSLNGLSLSWDAAGDDGDVGKASFYELRVSDAPITESSWDESIIVPLVNQTEAGDQILADIRGLDFGYGGHLAIQAIDNVGNRGFISASTAFQLPEPTTIVANSGSTEGFDQIEGTWATAKDGTKTVLTDSPSGRYTNNLDSSIVTARYNVVPGLLLSVLARYDIEANYDYGRVEIQADDGDWQEVISFSGVRDWGRDNLNLDDFLKGANTFALRFRLETDSSVTKDGWFIDEFSLLTANVE